MSEHFEEVWEEAEEIAIEVSPSPYDEIRLMLQDGNIDHFKMGEILFALCALSKLHDINTWKALKDCTEMHAIEINS